MAKKLELVKKRARSRKTKSVTKRVLYRDAHLEIRKHPDGDIIAANVSAKSQSRNIIRISPDNGTAFVTCHGIHDTLTITTFRGLAALRF